MDIGTIVAGLNALGNLMGANEPLPMTPAQAEEKPKKAQTPINNFVILPNQTPPMGVGVPPPSAPLMSPSNIWNQIMSANRPQMFPSLLDLYSLFFNTRF
jgi:hypothetical protein